MNNNYVKVLAKLARRAYKKNEVPVSAIIVYNNKIIAKAYNKKNIRRNALFHAEIICIYKACRKLNRWNLEGCNLYVSLEPCDMCKNAIQEARIDKVFYILSKGYITNKFGKTRYEQTFVDEKNEFLIMLKSFFKSIRK